MLTTNHTEHAKMSSKPQNTQNTGKNQICQVRSWKDTLNFYPNEIDSFHTLPASHMLSISPKSSGVMKIYNALPGFIAFSQKFKVLITSIIRIRHIKSFPVNYS